MSMPRAAPSGTDLLARLRELVEREQPGAARPLLNAVLRLAQPDAAVAELEARVLQLEDNAAGAAAVLDAAVAREPGSVALRLARAAARAESGDPAGAAADAAEAVVLRPAAARPKAMLGAFLNQLGRHAEARACLAEAVAAAPDDGGYRRHLAAAQAAGGDQAEAARTLEDGLARIPADVELRAATMLSRLRAGDCLGAEALGLAACRAGIADACVLGLLGHARSSLGRHDEAAQAYAEARKLAPEDTYVRHLAAAGGLVRDAGRCSIDYVRVVFDGYASRFDAHLIALGYRIPGLIRAELARLRGPAGRHGPILDLGCGTGLLAVAAADDANGPWIGVDLSPAMLAEARKRGLYAELHENDIERFLAEDGREFPVIVAGDCMPYLGDLTEVVHRAASRLAPRGRFLFSVEHLPETADAPPWRLGRLGRYAHTATHIEAVAAAARLTVAALRPEVVRLEAEMPVPGLLVILQRPPS